MLERLDLKVLPPLRVHRRDPAAQLIAGARLMRLCLLGFREEGDGERERGKEKKKAQVGERQDDISTSSLQTS